MSDKVVEPQHEKQEVEFETEVGIEADKLLNDLSQIFEKYPNLIDPIIVGAFWLAMNRVLPATREPLQFPDTWNVEGWQK